MTTRGGEFLHLGIVPARETPGTFMNNRGKCWRKVVLFVGIFGYVKKQLVGQETESVVISTNIKPVAPTNTALGNMSTLAQDDFIATIGSFSVSNRSCETAAVPNRLRRTSQQIDQSWSEIEIVMEFPIHAACTARPFDNQRNAASRYICSAVFSIDAKLAKVLTVIRREYDGCIIINPGGLELRDNATDIIVGIANARIVAVDQAF